MPAPNTQIELPLLGTDTGEMLNGDLSEIREAFNSAQESSLRQNWNREPERGFQPGLTKAAWCPKFLHILASLEDKDIILSGNLTTGSSLVMADVFQVFLDRKVKGDYLEIHVTPDNRTRVIAWTPERLENFREGQISVDEILVTETHGFSTRTWIDEESFLWSAYLRIPVILIDPRIEEIPPGLSLRGTFCRFDASPDTVSPVISSTSEFPNGPKFHQTSHWDHFRFQG